MTRASNDDGLRRRRELLALINAAWTTQAIHAACALGLPERLRAQPCDAAELARASGCDGTFELAPMGALLCDDDPQSLRAWALLSGSVSWARWGGLAQSVRTGLSHKRLSGTPDGFEHLDTDPAAAALFHRAMVELTRGVATDAARAIEVGGAQLIVDVGGGRGELPAALLAAQPQARGVLFDQPHALDSADATLAEHGVAARVRKVGGSFFDAVPAGGDLYVLKSVLHNWDDSRCVALLGHCRDAFAPGARLLVIERVYGDRPGARDRSTARSD